MKNETTFRHITLLSKQLKHALKIKRFVETQASDPNLKKKKREVKHILKNDF